VSDPYGFHFPHGFVAVEAPVGVVLPYAGPINVCTRAQLKRWGWLFCDGSAVAIADYPELHVVIRSLYGQATSSRAAFLLPDYRGVFLRGVSLGATLCDGTTPRDPDADGRTAAACAKGGNSGDAVGSVQRDAFQGHQHHYVMVANAGQPNQQGTSLASPTSTGTTTDIVTDGLDGDPRTSAETRPLNVYVNFLIKARSHVPPWPGPGGWCADTSDHLPAASP